MCIRDSFSFLLIIIGGLSVLLLLPSLIGAATASNLTILAIEEDHFYNYDFETQRAVSTNADWPVTMLFYGNAEVDKVKNMFFGYLIFAAWMHAELDDGQGWAWDKDRGTKSSWYSEELGRAVYLHMRLYAPNPPDYMDNASWGHYVLGTTHYDAYPFEEWSGYSEYAENDFASIAMYKGYVVFEDWANFYNYEPYDDSRDPDHVWLNNGRATAVYVP